MADSARFEGLDGLRGIAALAVLLHHAGPRLAGLDLLPQGYLAVDFFFMLSGFVMASAYERRFHAGLAPRAFLRARMERLYPLMAVGILLGGAVAMAYGMPAAELALRVAMQLLWVPLIAGSGSLFLLDGVQWSLFFEVFANFVHCLLLWRLSTGRLFGIAAAALLILVPFAWHFDGIGLGDRGTNILGGIPRVMFSYTLGVLLFRLRHRLPRRAVPAPLVISLVPAVLVLAGGLPSAAGDLVVVAACFPAIIILGLDARACMSWAGRISYPLYAVHLPIIFGVRMFGFGRDAMALAMLIAIGASFVLARIFEPPIRRRSDIRQSEADVRPPAPGAGVPEPIG